MPRAQKNPYPLRYQLEKLRLDVALKRSRLKTINRALPRPRPKRAADPELDAIAAERKDIEAASARVFERHCLSEERIRLDRGRKKLEICLREEADLKAQYEHWRAEAKLEN